jgi:hypothetical protein
MMTCAETGKGGKETGIGIGMKTGMTAGETMDVTEITETIEEETDIKPKLHQYTALRGRKSPFLCSILVFKEETIKTRIQGISCF